MLRSGTIKTFFSIPLPKHNPIWCAQCQQEIWKKHRNTYRQQLQIRELLLMLWSFFFFSQLCMHACFFFSDCINTKISSRITMQYEWIPYIASSYRVCAFPPSINTSVPMLWLCLFCDQICNTNHIWFFFVHLASWLKIVLTGVSGRDDSHHTSCVKCSLSLTKPTSMFLFFVVLNHSSFFFQNSLSVHIITDMPESSLPHWTLKCFGFYILHFVFILFFSLSVS